MTELKLYLMGGAPCAGLKVLAPDGHPKPSIYGEHWVYKHRAHTTSLSLGAGQHHGELSEVTIMHYLLAFILSLCFCLCVFWDRFFIVIFFPMSLHISRCAKIESDHNPHYVCKIFYQ